MKKCIFPLSCNALNGKAISKLADFKINQYEPTSIALYDPQTKIATAWIRIF